MTVLTSVLSARPAFADQCGLLCGETTVTTGDGQYDISQVADDPGTASGASAVGGRSHTSSCPGCTYQLVLACPTNRPGDQGVTSCSGQSAGCPAGALRYRLYRFRPGASTPQLLGSPCRGAPAAAVTAASLAPAVRNYLDHLVPPTPGIEVQPAEKALVNYPVLFDARGLAPVTASFAALGVPITVRATPVRYDWVIDGVPAMRTTSPGRPYDGHRATLGDGYYVSWTFPHHGVHTVVVTVSWQASFDAAGQAGVPVAGLVTRASAPVEFTVHTAVPQLIGG